MNTEPINYDIHSADYRPGNVSLAHLEGGKFEVRDWNGSVLYSGSSIADARQRLTVRRGVIKAALTRRANKRNAARVEACNKAGVTWAWLTEDMSAAEADAWLGLD